MRSLYYQKDKRGNYMNKILLKSNHEFKVKKLGPKLNTIIKEKLKQYKDKYFKV